MIPKPQSWRIAPDRAIALDRPVLMGILNVTPDSFSDGGAYTQVEAAVDAALRMIDEGAQAIDIGGESTRPGAQRVDAAEQMRRVLPVIEGLRNRSNVAVSIDTTLSEVAEAALDAGASIINDVSAGRDGECMFHLAAKRSCGLILMHRLLPPEQDSYSTQYAVESQPRYTDVVEEVARFLDDRAGEAIRYGVDREAIVTDPGLGFGKTVAQNRELIKRIDEIASLGYPVLGAASRKSFLDPSRLLVPRERVEASVAAAIAMYCKGVRLFRVHDVAAHREALGAEPGLISRGAANPLRS